MKMKLLISIGMLFALFLPNCTLAHTTDDKNRLIRAALRGVVRSWKDDFGSGMIMLKDDEVVDTWQGFLGRYGDGSWTLEEKISAFDWYLETLATNDCRSLPSREQNLVTAAISQCDVLNYTNSVPSLCNYALNPGAIRRPTAIRLAIKLSQVSDATTAFVETFVTNSIGFDVKDRTAACYSYAGRLLARNGMNGLPDVAVTNAVQMFYRNRMEKVVQTFVVDEVFNRYIGGYGVSSNRLDFAMEVLSHEDCNAYDRRDFASITNLLLSAGTPLRQLNIGE